MSEPDESIDVVGSATITSGREKVKIHLHGYPRALTIDGRGYVSLFYHKDALEEEYVAGTYIESQEDLDLIWDFLYKMCERHHEKIKKRIPKQPHFWGVHKKGFALVTKGREK